MVNITSNKTFWCCVPSDTLDWEGQTSSVGSDTVRRNYQRNPGQEFYKRTDFKSIKTITKINKWIYEDWEIVVDQRRLEEPDNRGRVVRSVDSRNIRRTWMETQVNCKSCWLSTVNSIVPVFISYCWKMYHVSGSWMQDIHCTLFVTFL